MNYDPRLAALRQRKIRRRNSSLVIIFAGIACIALILLLLWSGAKEDDEVVFNGSLPHSEYGSEIAVLKGSKANINKIIKNSFVDDSKVTKVKVSGKVVTSETGTYILKIKASDDSGNVVERTMDVIVTEPDSLSDNCYFITGSGFVGKREKGVTTINGTKIANKTYSLPQSYGSGLTKKMKKAFGKMSDAAAEDGISLTIVSGFRSYETQDGLFKGYSAKDGVEAAETYSARPGHSEHQLGEAADINDVSRSFADTKECAWLQEHAYEYGFILRYPEDGQEITGYIWEPWHYRYVGTELAEELYNGGDWITVEEYFGIDSKYY